MDSRLTQQLAFLDEIERLKVVYRRNRTLDRSRQENSAEHSWHVAMFALVLAEHGSAPDLDLFKVIRMLLIHDLVEVHAGDTWIYDGAAVSGQARTEEAAAAKLFGMLPADQVTEFMSLWLEFEQRESAEAKFAASLDSLQPLSNHLLSGDPHDEGPRPGALEVMDKKRHIAASSEKLWEAAQELIRESAVRGLYR